MGFFNDVFEAFSDSVDDSGGKDYSSNRNNKKSKKNKNSVYKNAAKDIGKRTAGNYFMNKVEEYDSDYDTYRD